MAMLLAALINTGYLIRIRSIRRKNEVRIAQQQAKSDLMELELKAIRSQMNPHFIFNCLNSIQDLILNEKTDASYDYIVLFAQLVRNTLNYSNQDFIPFEKELEFLNIYLRLEKLRFKDDFEYVIESNGVADVKIPSLLVQPFIENALVHGLLHKIGLKKLKVTFSLNEELICVIEDNGIGVEKSKAIKARQGGHTSFAMAAIQKRLELLKQQGFDEAAYTLEDLGQAGNSEGTRVILTIPYTQLF